MLHLHAPTEEDSKETVLAMLQGSVPPELPPSVAAALGDAMRACFTPEQIRAAAR